MSARRTLRTLTCTGVLTQVYFVPQVYNKLEEHRVRLEALQGDWRECEEDIEEILTWLKSIRQMLNADIPNTFDDLQADLTRCKVRQKSCSS